MALPPFASVTDLADYLGETITDAADVARAERLLTSASSLIRAESGSPWVDADGDLIWIGTDDANLLLVQETFESVTLAAAARAHINPEGLASETLGPYTARRFDFEEPGLFLTDAEIRAIAQAVALYRGGSSPGLWTLGTTRGDVETETVFLDTVYAGHPELAGESFPYRAIGDPT